MSDNHYWVYGHVIRSAEAFDNLPQVAQGAADCTYSLIDNALVPACNGSDCIVESSRALAIGKPSVRVLHQSGQLRARYARVGTYDIVQESIVCYPAPGADRALLAIHLISVVLPGWLEYRNMPSLHASGVEIDGKAVAFLSDQGQGKSTLAASFVQAGYRLLTDDVLPVVPVDGLFWGQPGYPMMRMWPETAQHLLGEYEHLPAARPLSIKRRVSIGENGFGSFCTQSRPLACIYLPERRPAGIGDRAIEIGEVNRKDAVIALMRNLFALRLVEGLRRQGQRLDLFARLVQQVPVRTVSYPSGFAQLPRVRDAILEDLSKL